MTERPTTTTVTAVVNVHGREIKVWVGSRRSRKHTIATVIKVGPDESKVWADDDDDLKMKGSESNRKASKYGLIKRT